MTDYPRMMDFMIDEPFNWMGCHYNHFAIRNFTFDKSLPSKNGETLLTVRGFGKDKIFDQGMRWVISRISTKVNRIPAYDEEIEIVTFPEPPKWFFLPRYTVVLDKDGNVLLEDETIWAVIDSKTRKPVLPSQINLDIEYKDEREKTLAVDSRIVLRLQTFTKNLRILSWYLRAPFSRPPTFSSSLSNALNVAL